MRKLLVGLGLVVTLLAILSPSALAGGWAVSTLDPMDPPVAGQETEVGFTIRQHGVTPVELEDVAIAVTGPSGAIAVFDAQQDGTTGHYVATVVFEEGQSTWEIRQGWFEAQQLGVIDVGVTAAPETPVAVESSSYRWPSGGPSPRCPSPRSCSPASRSPTRCQAVGARSRSQQSASQ